MIQNPFSKAKCMHCAADVLVSDEHVKCPQTGSFLHKTCVVPYSSTLSPASVGSITAVAQSPLLAGSPKSLLAVLSPQLADAESLERLAESLALLQPALLSVRNRAAASRSGSPSPRLAGRVGVVTESHVQQEFMKSDGEDPREIALRRAAIAEGQRIRTLQSRSPTRSPGAADLRNVAQHWGGEKETLASGGVRSPRRVKSPGRVKSPRGVVVRLLVCWCNHSWGVGCRVQQSRPYSVR